MTYIKVLDHSRYGISGIPPLPRGHCMLKGYNCNDNKTVVDYALRKAYNANRSKQPKKVMDQRKLDIMYQILKGIK